jgi:hypothetical protein
MNTSLHKLLRLLALVAALAGPGPASARHLAALDQCRLYGYFPHTAAYAQCRLNVRRYWTTGPCGYADFALTHREYCHLNPPPFL